MGRRRRAILATCLAALLVLPWTAGADHGSEIVVDLETSTYSAGHNAHSKCHDHDLAQMHAHADYSADASVSGDSSGYADARGGGDLVGQQVQHSHADLLGTASASVQDDNDPGEWVERGFEYETWADSEAGSAGGGIDHIHTAIADPPKDTDPETCPS